MTDSNDSAPIEYTTCKECGMVSGEGTFHSVDCSIGAKREPNGVEKAPREYIGINPGGNSNALINVLIPDDFNALHCANHPNKIHLIEKSAYDNLKTENEKLSKNFISKTEWFAQEAENEKLKAKCAAYGEALEKIAGESYPGAAQIAFKALKQWRSE